MLSKPTTFREGKYAEVNSNQYIGAKFLGKEVHAPHVQACMDSIIAEERMYNPNGYFEVIKHMGTGCVFGVKDTVTLNWSFYLQENFRIAYMRAPMQVKWANRVIRLWKISPARVREHHNPIVKRLP